MMGTVTVLRCPDVNPGTLTTTLPLVLFSFTLTLMFAKSSFVVLLNV